MEKEKMTFETSSKHGKKTLNKLSKDGDWRVRKAVAANPKTGKRILKRLCYDENVNVRATAARNIYTRYLMIGNESCKQRGDESMIIIPPYYSEDDIHERVGGMSIERAKEK